MVATSTAGTQPIRSGLRRANPRRDLSAIADLIEVCFADTLDAGGRSMLREMRLIASSGPLTWILARAARAIPAMDGFVWVEHDRVVGNVSLTATGYDRGQIVANVAVSPEYRGRGIARRLMTAAMDHITHHARFAVLQVDAGNTAARHLYESLGFQTQRTFTRWRRASNYRTPLLMPDPQLVHALRHREIPALTSLVTHLRPDSQGGIGWLRPSTLREIRPPRLSALNYLSSGKRAAYWVVPGADRTSLDAALRVEQRMGSLTLLFDLFVEHAHQGELEAPLLRYLLHKYPRRPFVTDHPADHPTISDTFQYYQFRPERTLVHMIWPVPSES